MSNRKMTVKFNGCKSNPKPLVGGGPQGTLTGQIEYILLQVTHAQETQFQMRTDSSTWMTLPS